MPIEIKTKKVVDIQLTPLGEYNYKYYVRKFVKSG